jgi:hypothetical protein
VSASVGENLGVDFLPGSLPYAAAGAWQPEPDLAAEVVWLDALTTNVDRTARNPNLLLWHERLWLIDHGAALYLQHGGLRAELAERPFPLIVDHVLLRRASSIAEAGERLRARLDLPGAIAESLALVPEDWFTGGDTPAVYAEYLIARCEWGGFAEEAERVRREFA